MLCIRKDRVVLTSKQAAKPGVRYRRPQRNKLEKRIETDETGLELGHVEKARGQVERERTEC